MIEEAVACTMDKLIALLIIGGNYSRSGDRGIGVLEHTPLGKAFAQGDDNY